MYVKSHNRKEGSLFFEQNTFQVYHLGHQMDNFEMKLEDKPKLKYLATDLNGSTALSIEDVDKMKIYGDLSIDLEQSQTYDDIINEFIQDKWPDIASFPDFKKEGLLKWAKSIIDLITKNSKKQ